MPLHKPTPNNDIFVREKCRFYTQIFKMSLPWEWESLLPPLIEVKIDFKKGEVRDWYIPPKSLITA